MTQSILKSIRVKRSMLICFHNCVDNDSPKKNLYPKRFIKRGNVRPIGTPDNAKINAYKKTLLCIGVLQPKGSVLVI